MRASRDKSVDAYFEAPYLDGARSARGERRGREHRDEACRHMPNRRGTALIVDDDAGVAQILAEMIRGCGYAVGDIVHSDSAAYALFDGGDRRWDVVFVDLNLGQGPTGVEVARRATARADNVIVMTGLPRLPESLTGVGLLLKPFSVEQVRLLLDNLGRSPRG
jgi:DNA-binding response OmpR family regulator